MADNLTILSMAKALASHSGRRQTIISENLANADTRDYAAKDLKPFSEVYSGPVDTTGPTGRGREPTGGIAPTNFSAFATRPGHAGFSADGDGVAAAEPIAIAKLGAHKPNNNTVSIQDQMARGVTAKLNHEMALSVFRKSMDLLRMSIGRN